MSSDANVIPPGPAWSMNDFTCVLADRQHPWFGTVGASQPYPEGTGIRILTSQSQGCGYADFLLLHEDCVCAVHNRRLPAGAVVKSDHGGWLGLTVRLSGVSRHLIGGSEEIRRSDRSCTLVYYPPGTETCEWFRPDGRLQSLTVLMRPSFLVNGMALERGQLPLPLRCPSEGGGGGPFVASMPFPLHLEPTLRRVLEEPTVGALRLREIQALGTLLCCFGANGLRHLSGCSAMPAILTPAEEVRIRELRSLLVADLSRNVSLHQLARRAGMNRTKLQAGFKSLFGETLFECVERHRMELAMQCLRQHGMPIYEIARRTGYLHARNFSAAFHRYYGVLPREVH